MIAYDWKLEKIPLTNRFKRWYCFWCKRNAQLLYWLTECLFSQQNASKNEKKKVFVGKEQMKIVEIGKKFVIINIMPMLSALITNCFLFVYIFDILLNELLVEKNETTFFVVVVVLRLYVSMCNFVDFAFR